MMNAVSDSSMISEIYCRGRHLRLSIVILSQAYFPKPGKFFSVIKSNSTIQIFFRMGNQSEINLIGQRLECTKQGQLFFINLIKKFVHSKKYGYIAVFLEEIHDQLRYRFNLLNEDKSGYQTVVTP